MRVVAALALVALVACGASDGQLVVSGDVGAMRAQHLDAAGVAGPVEPERDPLPTKEPVRLIPSTGASRGGERSSGRQRLTPTPPGSAARSGGSLTGPGQVNGYPCGGDLPPCSVLRRESGGQPGAVNRSGCSGRGCYGLWQFDPVTFIPGCTVSKWRAGTCGAYRGFQFANEAPVDVQNDRAREVYAGGRGCSHWGVC